LQDVSAEAGLGALQVSTTAPALQISFPASTHLPIVPQLVGVDT